MNRLLNLLYARQELVLNKLESISRKLKGGRIEKWGFYWKGVYFDYKEVFLDVAKEARSKPKKTLAISAGFGVGIYALKTNPDEIAFRNQLLTSANQILLVSDTLKNPISANYVKYLIQCYNEGLIRSINLGFFTLLWIDNYDQSVSLYAAQCSYLKPKFSNFYTRILDVGAFGKWYALESKLKDYDINPDQI